MVEPNSFHTLVDVERTEGGAVRIVVYDCSWHDGSVDGVYDEDFKSVERMYIVVTAGKGQKSEVEVAGSLSKQ
jgi:hypothetical protein